MLCRAAWIIGLVFRCERPVERSDFVDTLMVLQTLDIKAEADLNVLLRQIVFVDEDLTNLVGWVKESDR